MSTLPWLDNLMQPVHIMQYGQGNPAFIQQFADNEWIFWEMVDKLPDIVWPWFPQHLPVYGIAQEDSAAHIWFVGEPIGQEESSWRDLVLAVGRGQKLLTPMTENIVDSIGEIVHVAVFTTPS